MERISFEEAVRNANRMFGVVGWSYSLPDGVNAVEVDESSNKELVFTKVMLQIRQTGDDYSVWREEIGAAPLNDRTDPDAYAKAVKQSIEDGVARGLWGFLQDADGETKTDA